MTQQDLKQAYNRQNWQTWLHEIFGSQAQFETQDEKIEIDKEQLKSIYRFASIKLADGKNLAVLDIETQASVQIARNRIGLNKSLVKLIDHARYHGILAFYHSEDKSQTQYRLSFISSEPTIDADGNFSIENTPPKRFTYVLGENEKTKTPADRLKMIADKRGNTSLEDIKNAFSVETLTKEFYAELFAWYQWALSEEMGVTFPNDRSTETDDRQIEEHIIRLITRLMFVWFIKQRKLVPDTIFEIDSLNSILKDFDATNIKQDNYYRAILQNLFFATLNSKIEDRAFAADGTYHENKAQYGIKTLYRYADEFSISADKVMELFGKVPFLNGGLFECLDKDTPDSNGKIIYCDGFSRKKDRQSRAHIPNVLFFHSDKGLIPLLSRYNFTIEENSPSDVEVALDPELLGKVFENLLGTYNPETKETARKQSGSFYTPREIVNYMVDESLKAYLANYLNCDAADLNDLFDDVNQSNFTNGAEIYNALLKVKILDPACGSGAFPMGALNRMLAIIGKLPLPKSISIYDLKLHLIENCIYGVDIQSIAVQISKLRFFISLICEQTPDVALDNFGIKPLPNLETKFVAANTLIGLAKKEAQGNLFEDPQIEVTKKSLLEIRHQHFSADTAKKKRDCRADDKKLREKLAKLLEENNDFAPENAKQLAAWNPYDQNASSPFFDSEWMFGLKDGFDILIGNPPYVSTKGTSTDDKKLFLKEYGFADDTYNHFFFKGIKLLDKNGNLTYIVPKTFWTTQTKKNLRDLLLSKRINYIFDTANPFEAAMVDTCIISVSNTIRPNNEIIFLDGSKDLNNPFYYTVNQNMYKDVQNSVIFKPTEENLKIFNLYGKKVKELYDTWWEKISTSKNITKYAEDLERYRNNLKPGDITLLGCLTEGGQGLATANNGKYIAVRKSTKWAKKIIESRPKKLKEAVIKNKIKDIDSENTANYLNSLSEFEIANLFDGLKEKYGRDIFGQGYLYRLIDDNEIADVDSLTDDEKENGIDTSKNYYVPYDKGDKDGNRWFLETPFAIAWSKENVGFLKTDPKARYQGYMYYFKEGFCWSAVNGTRSSNDLKFRFKGKSVTDVQGMSLHSVYNKVTSKFLTCIGNTSFISLYTELFINSTVIFQINDARQIPIIIPTDNQLVEFEKLFEQAYRIKQLQIKENLSEKKVEFQLEKIQLEIENRVKELYRI